MATAQRPARSDAHLPPEEAARIEAEVRGYFAKVAPRRHTKPSRSDCDNDDAASSSDALQYPLDQLPIPELEKLRRLVSDPQKLVAEGSEVVEEFVETEYYKDLNCVDKLHYTRCDLNRVDKLHCTTGMGFIKVEKPNSSTIDLTTTSHSTASNVCCKGNPATNDWIPSPETVILVSNKPNRSDG
ncbi:hypothetical protein ACMD2_06118 [Ananas comosus]|uniref:Uncharacterized protein n=1 Tax=Ananas comosus TaxID=4615 RepID=A0A199VJK4_ANACO|nr:hypothetical protein ACMD2_06118 [Ananas comosus]